MPTTMSTAASESETKPESKPKLLPETRKLDALFFVAPAMHDARYSVSLSAKDCLSITPAMIAPDGEAVPIEKGQRADGFLVRRKMGQPREMVKRFFIHWGNIADVRYSE